MPVRPSEAGVIFPSRQNKKSLDPELHTILLGLMQELGYPVTGLLGLCEGFTNVGMKAFFEHRLDTCNALLAYINDTLAYSDFKVVKKRLHSQNHKASTQEDKNLVTALDFLDEIALHQTHSTSSQIFNAADSSKMLTKDQIEQEAGLFHIQLPSLANYEDFTTYFNQLLLSIQTAEIPISIKVEMGYALSSSRTLLEAHVIAICYDPVFKNFVLIDINQLPIKTDVVSFDALTQFISDSITLLNHGVSSFRTFLYTTNGYKDSLNLLSQTTLSLINANVSEESTIGLSINQKKAFKEFRAEGLTAAHLRQWHSKEHFSGRHLDALSYLIRECALHPEQALEELSDLNYYQAEAITRGLSRDQVLGLQPFQIITLEECKQFGLTATHLRHWKGGSFGSMQNMALKRLLAKKQLSPDEVIAQLNIMKFPQ